MENPSFSTGLNISIIKINSKENICAYWYEKVRKALPSTIPKQDVVKKNMNKLDFKNPVKRYK